LPEMQRGETRLTICEEHHWPEELRIYGEARCVKCQMKYVTVFQKAEIYSARQELRRLLGVLETIRNPGFKREAQLELAKALKVIRPVYTTTRDGELERLLKEAEEYLDPGEP